MAYTEKRVQSFYHQNMSMVKIGISGWKYEGWRGKFYPSKLPVNQELAFVAQSFSTVEINGTFYSLQRPSSYQTWYHQTPPDFIFSVKANRYITHIKQLHKVEIEIANFIASGVLALQEKLGPILWQFPPSLKFNPELIENFLDLLPRNFQEARKLGKNNTLKRERTYLKVKKNLNIRHAIEVRNDSFLNPWFIELMRTYETALVFADSAGKWPYFEDITSDFIYIRLHGKSELYTSGYDQASLGFWNRRINTWKKGLEPKDRQTLTEYKALKRPRDVFVYFDNDAKTYAPQNAKSLTFKQKAKH